MIKRYSRPEMLKLWSDDHKLAIWLELECRVCEAQAELGIIPQKEADALIKKLNPIIKQGSFDHARIKKIEDEVHHDVIAFLTYIGEAFLDGRSQYLHWGLTSSDILDSGLAVQLNESTSLLDEGLGLLCEAFKDQAMRHKKTLMMGRSHGMHGEPITFGFKMAQGYAEFVRWRERLMLAREHIAVIAISGAMGNFAHLPPALEQKVAQKMGLQREPLSTQVIPRDRHGFFMSVLAGIASSLERVAIDIRHLQRSEVGEVREAFGSKQKGSSAMPHKRNPILSENVTGLARLIRAMVTPALENIALWHERDMSHSSVERVILPDGCILLDFALHRMAQIIKALEVDEQQMAQNIMSSDGLWASGALLLALTQKGMSREDAYLYVQKCAMTPHQKFKDAVMAHPEITSKLTQDELNKLFDPSHACKNMDEIYGRIFK